MAAGDDGTALVAVATVVVVDNHVSSGGKSELGISEPGGSPLFRASAELHSTYQSFISTGREHTRQFRSSYSQCINLVFILITNRGRTRDFGQCVSVSKTLMTCLWLMLVSIFSPSRATRDSRAWLILRFTLVTCCIFIHITIPF